MLARLEWIPPEPDPKPDGGHATDVESGLMMLTFTAGYLMMLIGVGACAIS